MSEFWYCKPDDLYTKSNRSTHPSSQQLQIAMSITWLATATNGTPISDSWLITSDAVYNFWWVDKKQIHEINCVAMHWSPCPRCCNPVSDFQMMRTSDKQLLGNRGVFGPTCTKIAPNEYFRTKRNDQWWCPHSTTYRHNRWPIFKQASNGVKRVISSYVPHIFHRTSDAASRWLEWQPHRMSVLPVVPPSCTKW